MAIANGGYVMVNAAKLPGTVLALDTQGASNTKGANVRLNTRNDSDAQIVTVQTYGAFQVIRFPFSGMVLDVKGAKAANGQNVQQYVWNQGKSQQWSIEPTGNTYTVGGESYDAYNVKSALNTSYELEAYGAASAVTSGTNLDIATHSTEQDHEFVFVPRSILANGKTYRLVSVMDQKVCLGLSGKTGDTAVRLAGVADDNNQRWTFASAYPNCRIESAAQPGYYLAPKGYAPGASTPVIVAKNNGDESLLWVALIVGTTSYNGQQVPIVELGNKEGVNYVLDVKGANTAVGTVLQTYARNNGKSQRFVAVPESILDTTLAAPAQLRAAYEVGGKVAGELWGNGTVPAHLAFVGDTDEWDARYRVRYRKATAGNEEFGAWSAWRNWANGSNANEGWGAGNAPSCPTTLERDPQNVARRYTKAVPFAVDVTGNDLAEVQAQVRRWGADAHGPQANASTTVKFRPTFNLDGFTWSPEGLAIRYSSDQPRNENQLTIYRVTCEHDGDAFIMFESADGYPIAACPSEGVATLPQGATDYVPAEGDTITATIRWANVDGAYMEAEQTVTGTVSYDAGRGMTIAPTYEAPSAANGWMLHVDATSVDADTWTLYLAYGGESYDKFPDNAGTWDVPVQFGRAFDVFLVARKGDAWDVWHPATFAAVAQPGAHLFNFVEPDGAPNWYMLAGNVSGPPNHQRTLSRDYDAQTTNGNAFEVIHYGNATSADVSASGYHVPELGIPHTSDEHAQAMLGAGYCWYRGPKYPERVQRVAVTQVTFDDTDPRMVRVSISARQIDYPATN